MATAADRDRWTSGRLVSRSPEDTWEAAAALLRSIPGPAVLALHGHLGSGKTCFVQGLAAALGIRRAITSPTFTLVNEYRSGSRPLYHIDLYRLTSPDEVFTFGFEDYMEPDGITAVEWAERAGDLIPPSAVHLEFRILPGEDVREITLKRRSPPPLLPGG